MKRRRMVRLDGGHGIPSRIRGRSIAPALPEGIPEPSISTKSSASSPEAIVSGTVLTETHAGVRPCITLTLRGLLPALTHRIRSERRDDDVTLPKSISDLFTLNVPKGYG